MPSEDRRVSGIVQVEHDSGSPTRVAHDLWKAIANNEKLFSTSGNRKAMLDLFAECLDAAKGFRQQT